MVAKQLFYTLFAAYLTISPTLQSSVKGPQNPLQVPEPVNFVHNVLSADNGEKYCSPSGQIQDACCDYKSIENIQTDTFDKIQRLIKTDFFKYYRADLWKECPFWNEDSLCTNRDCSVATVDEILLPKEWRKASLSAIQLPQGRSLSPKKCTYKEQDFCLVDDKLDSDGVAYIDLTENPERFTGYAGPSSARVWKAIYEENCFDIVHQMTEGCETCSVANSKIPQKSTNPFAHVPKDKAELHQFLNDIAEESDGSGVDEGSNLDCFVNRIGSHPERLQNVYFAYAVLLRAVNKIGPYLEHYEFRAEDSQEKNTGYLVQDLIKSTSSCPPTFDEKIMFQGAESKELKQEFKEHFRNVSRIMDCVGCEKCRLWGKLQTVGMGTALKVLFSYKDKSLNPFKNPDLFERNEIVALFNTFNRFSESLNSIQKFRNIYMNEMTPKEPSNKMLAEIKVYVFKLLGSFKLWGMPVPDFLQTFLLDTR